MKYLRLILLSLVLVLSLVASARADIDNNIKIKPEDEGAQVEPWLDVELRVQGVNDYVWRGLSLTERQPALQWEAYFLSKWGFFFGLWESNVKFEDNDGRNARQEVEPYFGYFFSIDDFEASVGIESYLYPNTVKLDYNEWFLELAYKIFRLEMAYSSNQFGESDPGTYVAGGVEVPIPERWIHWPGVSVGGHVGVFHFWGPNLGGSDYEDYEAFLKKEWKHVEFAVKWINTDGGYNDPHNDGSKFVAELALHN